MRQGFTLIETLTAIAIITIIAGIGAGATFLRSTQPSSELNAAVQTLVADLRYASSLATSTQINHTVFFSSQGYTITRLSQTNFTVKEVMLKSPIQITQTSLPSNTVEFNTLGAVTQSGTITMSYNLGLNMTIDVRPSGYVRIQ